MQRRRGETNPNMKYYNEYRNSYYNPDDEINRPGVNVNWKDIQQGFSLVEAKNNEQDNRLDAVEAKNAEQDERLDAVEAKNAEQDERLDAIEAKNTEQDGRLDALEAGQQVQDNRLDAIEAEQTTQNGRLDAIETKNGEQDQMISAIQAKNTEQDAALAQQAEDIADLDTRLTDAEGDIDAERARNTAQDAAIADNSARITRIEDYGPRISVIEAEQVTQNQQIAALQAKDTALDADIAALQAKDTALDADIAALQAKDTAQDADIAALDSRLDDVEDAIDTRLTAVEQKNTEQDATLANHETRIADNTARNTAQEQAISDNSARITALRQNVNSNTARITALEGELPERTTPTNPDEARTTVIGEVGNNFTVEAMRDSNGESMTLSDGANNDTVSVGFTSNEDGESISIGGKSYKLGGISDNSARITALRQNVNSNTDRIAALEGELPVRTTPTNPDEARTTVIGEVGNNFTVEAMRDSNGESMTLSDGANNDTVSVGFTSNEDGESISIGGKSYKLGGNGLEIVEFTSKNPVTIEANNCNTVLVSHNIINNTNKRKRYRIISVLLNDLTDYKTIVMSISFNNMETNLDTNSVWPGDGATLSFYIVLKNYGSNSVTYADGISGRIIYAIEDIQ